MSESEPVSKNLSETLFARNKLAKETSALTRYLPSSEAILEEKNSKDNHHWYRNLRKLQWVWQGVDPIEQEAVLAKIASSTHDRSHDEWLDTVAGYRSGTGRLNGPSWVPSIKSVVKN